MLDKVFENLEVFRTSGPTDPLRYYTHPLVGWLYRHRIMMGLEMIQNMKFDSILEIGFGSGMLLPYFAQMSKEVHGLDLDCDLKLVEDRLKSVSQSTFNLKNGSILKMPYLDNSFDCIVAFSILEHVKEHQAAVKELTRVLKPNGRAIIGMPAVNKAMDYAFRSIGFNNIDHFHVTTPYEFEQSAKKVLKLTKKKTFPAHFPTNLSLYTCFCLEKSQ